jgi:DUF971 family protein
MEIALPAGGRLVGAELLGTVLLLQWGDGHRGELPLDSVRRACPCAGCGAPRAAPKGGLHVLPPAPPSEVQAIQAVGRYALQFIWKDGHQAGIYNLELLRGLCQCPDCSRPAKGKP